MKTRSRLAFVVGALVSLPTTFGQVTLGVSGSSIVCFLEPGVPLTWPWVAQVYAGPTESSLVAFGEVIYLGEGSRAGRLAWPSQVEIGSVSPGQTAYVQLRVFPSCAGACEWAVADGGPCGESNVLPVKTGGGGGPPPPPASVSWSPIWWVLQPTNPPPELAVPAGQDVSFDLPSLSLPRQPLWMKWTSAGPWPNSTGEWRDCSSRFDANTIHNVQPEDAGVYAVAGTTNFCGTVFEHYAPVVILEVVSPFRFSAIWIDPTDGLFHATLAGDPGVVYRVETSTNLTDWVLGNSIVVTNASGTVLVTDPEPIRAAGRFYRAVAGTR